MTRIPAVPVYPSFLFIFQEDKIIAEIKKWNSKYCSLISDSCFQWLHADRKFWSRRYLFPHLCIHISDNTGYPDREFFFLIQEELNSFKESIAIKGPVDRMQRSVAETFQEVIELTGSLCFMFRSTPTSSSPKDFSYFQTLLEKFVRLEGRRLEGWTVGRLEGWAKIRRKGWLIEAIQHKLQLWFFVLFPRIPFIRW